MKRTISFRFQIALVILPAIAALFLASSSSAHSRSVVVVFTGTSTGEMREIDGVEHDCFDVDITDPESGRVVGTGTDCLDLASITPIGDDGGFTLNNVQFFDLRGGSIVTSITTTIQPVGGGSPDATHVTGAVPDEGTNQIVDGDRKFQGATGRVRLNGGVDMSLFGENIITFDCVFRIDFDE